MYQIIIRDRDGTETLGHFEPNTLAACAGAMVALYSCAENRRTVEHCLKHGMRSYTASNSRGGKVVTAKWIADTRAEAIAHAQRSGAWPMPRPKGKP